jgi:hypothetical protein
VSGQLMLMDFEAMVVQVRPLDTIFEETVALESR